MSLATLNRFGVPFSKLPRQPEIGGGDTAFANLYLAYELLSDPIKHLLQELTAIHDGAHAWTRGYGLSPKPGQTFPVSEHPIVVKHPLNGRPLLFVNSGFTTRIPQLSRDESEVLLHFLFRHIEKSLIIQNRLHWTANTLVLWDNWATRASCGLGLLPL
jgi:taurine dioxygenase